MARNENTLTIDALKQGRVTMRIIGSTPMYFNAMSRKAKNTLLIGGGKKTTSEKKDIKHNPEQEFTDSLYKCAWEKTLLGFPAPGIKNAMATAALVTDGVKKTDIQKLVFIPVERVPVWGIPRLRIDVVRSADMNKTPDMRTRACLRRWCAEVDIAFVIPALSIHSIASLLQNAGMVCGIGDFRQEKGKGSYGTFRIVSTAEDEAEWMDITTNEGRQAQLRALSDIQAYDDESQELWEFLREARGKKVAALKAVA